jgi:hypothetical protein
MARIESYEPSGAPFIDGPDREPYIGRACVIQRVIDDPKARYGPRWVVEAAFLDSGEVVALGMGKNPWRDQVMGGLALVLSDGESIDPVVLFRDTDHMGANKQAPWSFRSATDAEIEAAGQLAAVEDDPTEAEPTPKRGKA